MKNRTSKRWNGSPYYKDDTLSWVFCLWNFTERCLFLFLKYQEKNRQPYIDRMYEVNFNVVFKSQVTMHVQYVKDTIFSFVYVFNYCDSLPYFLSMHKSNRCHLHSGNCLHFIFILIRTGFCVAQFWIFYFVFARLFRLFSSVLCCFPTIFFFCYSHSCILSQWHSKPCKFFSWWITLLR